MSTFSVVEQTPLSFILSAPVNVSTQHKLRPKKSGLVKVVTIKVVVAIKVVIAIKVVVVSLFM